MPAIQMQTYYEVLEIPPDAPQHEIHQAYQRAKQTYSPDSPALYTMFTEDEARQLLRLIEEAYTILGSIARREEYDRQLKSGQVQPPAAVAATTAPQETTEAPAFALPDPMVPGLTTPSPFDAPVAATPLKIEEDKVPEGFAKTRFSTYEVDSTFEAEIHDNEDFDGVFLQRVRLYKSISVEQIAAETRISKTYIHAVEANHYEALPAPVFVRGFIVQIAKILGLPEQKVASSYVRILKNQRGD